MSDPLDPEQGFFTLGTPTGTCNLPNNPISVTCVYPITVANDAANIDELDNAGGEFAYVFRTKVTDSAGNVSDEAIRGYVVVTGDDTPNPPGQNNRAPKADFSAAQEENSLKVKFIAQASSDPDGDKLSYSWDFGDGSSASSRDYTKTYEKAKDYQVKLTVSDGQGGEDTQTKTVTVEEVKSEPEPKPENCTNPVNIPDEELEDGIRAELDKFEGELTCEDLALLKTLDIEFRDADYSPVPISNLEGLQYAANLTKLRLASHELDDLSPLANLTDLTDLSLAGNGIDDLGSLANLTNLTNLNLNFNEITDISALVANSGLDEGDTINLFGNLLSPQARKDVETLRERSVTVSGTAPATCTSPVTIPDATLEAVIRQELGKPEGELTCENLAMLETLDVGAINDRAATSLEGLQFAVNLNELFLSASVRDISPLADLTGLVTLDLEGNRITNLDPLKNLTNLTTLDLSINFGIKDLHPLAGLSKLTSLNLFGNQVTDLSPLANLTNLTTLNLSSNFSSNLRPLAGLTKLTELRLQSNEISDLEGLEGLTRLTSLLLSNDYGRSENKISDLGPLVKLTNLEVLTLDYNNVSNLSPLENLTNLAFIGLDSNVVEDIGPLVANSGLGTGDVVSLGFNEPLRGNPQVLEDIETLRERGVEVRTTLE